MDIKSKVLMIVLLAFITLSVASIFYQTVIQQDFHVVEEPEISE